MSNPGAKPYSTMYGAFLEFHREHPHVWRLVKKFALQADAAYSVALRDGRRPRRIGVKLIFERLRWELDFVVAQKSDCAGFKLNNNFTAFYARLLLKEYPRMVRMIETRVQRSKRTPEPFLAPIQKPVRAPFAHVRTRVPTPAQQVLH